MTLHRAPGIEFADPADQRALQETLLRRHVAHCAANSPWYRERLAGIDPEAVALDRLADLPVTDKRNLAAANDRFIAVPPEAVADIVFTSGTTGTPTEVVYTDGDLERLAYNEQISFAACGIGPADVALLSCTMDRCFVAGLAYYSGLRAVGAAVARCGSTVLPIQQRIIDRLRPTAIVGVPTFIRRLGVFLAEHGLDPATIGVRRLVCIGEPLRGVDLAPMPLTADIERLWQAKAYSTYASTETITTFCECTAQAGGHLHPELAIVELLDTDGRPVARGEVGEVVVTPLQIEGLPLLRFRTGDLSFLIDEPCVCGRRSPRLGPILGRRHHMLKIRGTTVYPQAIHAVLGGIPEIDDYYIEVEQEANLSDRVTVHAALREDGLAVADLEAALQGHLRVRVEVRLEARDAVHGVVHSSASRKPTRWLDRREVPA